MLQCLHCMNWMSDSDVMNSPQFKLVLETQQKSVVVGNILTPLHYALLFKKSHIASCMIESGVDTTMHDATGLSLVHYEVYCRETNAICLLIEGDEHSMMLNAISMDNVDAVRAMIQSHVQLPKDLHAIVRVSRLTKAYLLSLGRHFLYLREAKSKARVAQNEVFTSDGLQNAIVGQMHMISEYNTMRVRDLLHAHLAERRAASFTIYATGACAEHCSF